MPVEGRWIAPGPGALVRDGPPSTVGTVLGTLVLLNNTLVPGNFLPLQPEDPGQLAYDASTGDLVIVDHGSSSVTFIDAAMHDVGRTVPVGSQPDAVALDPASGQVFVANNGTDNVSVLTGLGSVVGAVPTGLEPISLAYDARNGYVYVANRGSDNLTVINGSSDGLVGSVALASTPTALSCDGATGEVYVVASNSSDLTVVSPADTIATEVNVGKGEIATAYDAKTGNIYVGGNQTVAVNGTQHKVVATIGYAASPEAFAIDPISGDVFMTWGSSLLVIGGVNNTVFRTLTISASGPVGPSGITYDPVQAGVYLSLSPTNEIGEVNITTGTSEGPIMLEPSVGSFSYDPSSGGLWATGGPGIVFLNASTDLLGASLPAGEGSISLVVDPTNGYGYVANTYSSNVTVFDAATERLVGSVTVPAYPFDLVYDPVDGQVYVICGAATDLTRIDPSSGVATLSAIPMPTEPQSLAVSPASDRFYMPAGYSDTVAVVNGTTGASVAEVPVGQTPLAMGYDPLTGDLYVANSGSDNLTVINGSTERVITSIPVGTGPGAIVFDGGNGELYVANSGSNNVSVVDATENAVVGSITVGDDPGAMAYDPRNGDLYVADEGSVSVIGAGPPECAPCYATSFVASGLPGGASWWVTVGRTATDRTTEMSTRGTDVFLLPNSTYEFSVQGPPGYTATPANGSITVAGNGPTLDVAFAGPPPSPTAKISSEEAAALGAGIAVALVLIIVALWLRRSRR